MAIYIIYVLVDMFKWHKDCPDHIHDPALHNAGVVHVTRKGMGDTSGTKGGASDTPAAAKDVSAIRDA